jgi:capsular polysaccharide transport system permease protein
LEDQPKGAAPEDAADGSGDPAAIAERRRERRERRASIRSARRSSRDQAEPAEGADTGAAPEGAAGPPEPADADSPTPTLAPAPAPTPAPAAAGVVIPLREADRTAAGTPRRLHAMPPAPAPGRGAAAAVSLPKPSAMPPKPLPGARPGQAPAAAPVPPAGPARLRTRHVVIALSFLATVVLPAMAAAWYLWAVALDQYASRVGFSVQKEEAGSAVEILGGITELSGSSSSDTDILYKYLQSRELITIIDTRLNLRDMFTRPEDPLVTLPPEPTIEDLEAQWGRMVDIFYDTASFLIEVRVRAFTPGDSRAITEAILAESTRKLNDITSTGREDATGYAREELNVAKARLRDARQALTAFRIRTQIVDPAADVQGRMGLLNNLLSQQAMALIELDLVAATATPSDPRYIQAQRRVDVIEARLREERARFGDSPDQEDQRYAELVAEFEALSVDLEFAQQAYLTSLATYDAAIAEAQRKSRYLATYLPPTLAERAEFPQRWLLFALFAGAAFALWAIGVMVYYTLRDRI